MTHFRPFRNDDSPALAALWNRGAPATSVARPLTVHEFDAQVVNSPLFDAQGLIVAAREGVLVGYAHAGFGPDDSGEPLHLDLKLGTVAMLVVHPDHDDPELGSGLLARAEDYLRGRGAEVLYAGGQYPVNPFYWGIYGGSEWSGVLDGHDAFHRAVIARRFEPVSTSLLLEADLSQPEVRDPRGVLLRRTTHVEVIEDNLPPGWWKALALGDFRPTTFRLLSKLNNDELARATTWDMTRFSRLDHRGRIGLIDMEVAPSVRRKGYGRHLVNEILRLARSQAAASVSVQTNATNLAAQALYQSTGFLPVESATLYRLPGSRSTHPGPAAT